MKPQIFISYRREGGRGVARNIELALRSEYNVFFDFTSIKNGVFNEHIFRAIDDAPIFIIVLTKGCMQQCVNEDDWVRNEIEHVLKFNDNVRKRLELGEIDSATADMMLKNIIPINVDNLFDGFPKDDKILSIEKAISSIQFSELITSQLFDVSLNYIVENRIRPYINVKANNTGDKKQGLSLEHRQSIAFELAWNLMLIILGTTPADEVISVIKQMCKYLDVIISDDTLVAIYNKDFNKTFLGIGKQVYQNDIQSGAYFESCVNMFVDVQQNNGNNINKFTEVFNITAGTFVSSDDYEVNVKTMLAIHDCIAKRLPIDIKNLLECK